MHALQLHAERGDVYKTVMQAQACKHNTCQVSLFRLVDKSVNAPHSMQAHAQLQHYTHLSMHATPSLFHCSIYNF